MKWLIKLLIIAIILGFIWSGLKTAKSKNQMNKNAVVSSYPAPSPYKISDNKLFSLVQEWRKSLGFAPYIKDNRLCEIAKDRSDDEFDNHIGFMSKYSNNKNFPWVMQENLALVEPQRPTEQSYLEGWLNSPPHRAALEKPYTYSCIACDKQCV